MKNISKTGKDKIYFKVNFDEGGPIFTAEDKSMNIRFAGTPQLFLETLAKQHPKEKALEIYDATMAAFKAIGDNGRSPLVVYINK